MKKLCYFYIDDIIWTLRDLTRTKPASLFDVPFMKMLKEGHDRYGMKVQLNLFYRTDFYYGEDEFTLSEVPDTYKSEFESASDWLRFGFHSKQEYPDYPYINASYEDVKINIDRTIREVTRFAGSKSFAYATVPHWMPISKEGCRALKDTGIKVISVSNGEKIEYSGDAASLPYGHAKRLMQNKKPDSGVYCCPGRAGVLSTALHGYNHLSQDIVDTIYYTTKGHYDEALGIHFKPMSNGGILLNTNTMESLAAKIPNLLDKEYIGYGVHEQYFYPEYCNYQPDYADKLLYAAKQFHENGFTYIFIEDLF